tara:strand:+ start:8446 stop:8835 length:390 start_codon:yes stop_codon:yes gene_type:complete
MITLSCIILAGISNAIMDKISFHYDNSIFKNTSIEQWANPKLSWKNKWKNGDRKNGERFIGSSTIFVWTTDLWHLAQSFMITFFCLGIVFYQPFIDIGISWLNLIIDFIIYKTTFSLVFELFFSKIFKR